MPALSPTTLLALTLLVSGLAVWALRKRRVGRLVILLSMFVAPSAHAFFDTPWIAPAAPRADEIVSVNIHDGICDAIFERQGYPQITRDGNTVRILEYGHHWEDDELCVYEIGTTVDPVGSFLPGDYTLIVDFVYENYPFGYVTMNLGVIPFTVTGAPAMQVPALSPTALLALTLLVLGLAVWALLRTRRARRLLILSSVFVAANAHAFFDPPWITPAAPRAGEAVSVNIRGGICDGTVFRPGYPQITRDGNTIRIIEYGVHEDFEDFCIYPVGTLNESIGTFPAGDYTLTVDFLYEDFVLGYTITTLGVIPFTVTGASPVSQVPSSSLPSLFALLFLMSGIALSTLGVRRRRSSWPFSPR